MGLRMNIFPVLVVGLALSLAACGRDPGPGTLRTDIVSSTRYFRKVPTPDIGFAIRSLVGAQQN
jgi:hypothetical protein